MLSVNVSAKLSNIKFLLYSCTDKYKTSALSLDIIPLDITYNVSALTVSTCQGLPGPKGIKGEPFYGAVLPGHPVSSLTALVQ